jgi:hypothetical protein
MDGRPDHFFLFFSWLFWIYIYFIINRACANSVVVNFSILFCEIPNALYSEDDRSQSCIQFTSAGYHGSPQFFIDKI